VSTTDLRMIAAVARIAEAVAADRTVVVVRTAVVVRTVASVAVHTVAWEVAVHTVVVARIAAWEELAYHNQQRAADPLAVDPLAVDP